LRRSEIITWANDSSKPITVNVTMKPSFGETVSPHETHTPMLAFPDREKL
jgi:hypothetical protein